MITAIYYIASIASIAIFILSVQFKEKKNILLSQIFASLCYLIVYLITGAYSGVAIEVVEEVKDAIFYRFEKKDKKIPMSLLIIFIAVLITVSIITYDGPLSLLPLFINILYFISTYFKNPKYIRIVMVINAVLWICYNSYVGAYIIIIGNVLEIISGIISLIRFKSKNEKTIKGK